jgi:uncharacterized protein (TIGR03083 family)
VEVAEHIEFLQVEGERLAAAADLAGPDAPVPTCPEWVVRDLVRHVGGVHRWATSYVAGAHTEAQDVELEDLVGAWPADEELTAWFRRGHAALVTALSEADPDLECWTFLPAPSPRAMWARRQAHETAMHRVDAELAAGVALSPFTPAFAADGIDELLTCFVTRRGGRLRADPPCLLILVTAHGAFGWGVEIGPDGVTTSRRENVTATPGEITAPSEADSQRRKCFVYSSASELYRLLWNRRNTENISILEDASVLELFLDRVHVRWS